MLSKNNQIENARKHQPAKQRFALRKMTMGVASVLVGLTFVGGHEVAAHASTDAGAPAPVTPMPMDPQGSKDTVINVPNTPKESPNVVYPINKAGINYHIVDDDNQQKQIYGSMTDIHDVGTEASTGLQDYQMPRGYEFAPDEKYTEFPKTVVIPDGMPGNVGDIYIHLVHKKTPTAETKSVSRHIYGYCAENYREPWDSFDQTVTFTRSGIRDEVTGKTVWNDWDASEKTLPKFVVPKVEGYEAGRTEVPELKVTPEDIGHNSGVGIIYNKVESSPYTVGVKVDLQGQQYLKDMDLGNVEKDSVKHFAAVKLADVMKANDFYQSSDRYGRKHPLENVPAGQVAYLKSVYVVNEANPNPELTAIKDKLFTELNQMIERDPYTIPAFDLPYGITKVRFSIGYKPATITDYVRTEIRVFGPDNQEDRSDYWATIAKDKITKDQDGSWSSVSVNEKDLKTELANAQLHNSKTGLVSSLPTKWVEDGYIPVITDFTISHNHEDANSPVLDEIWNKLEKWLAEHPMTTSLPAFKTEIPLMVNFYVHYYKPVDYKPADKDDDGDYLDDPMNYFARREINLHNPDNLDKVDKTVTQTVHFMRQSVDGHAGYVDQNGEIHWNPWIVDPETPSWAEYQIPQKTGYTSQIDESEDNDRSDLVDAKTVDAIDVDLADWVSQDTPLQPDENGYYPDGYDEPADVDVYYVKNDTNQPTPTPHPVVDTSVTYVFYDDIAKKNVGTPVVVSGQPGSTQTTGLKVPAGYKLADKQALPTSLLMPSSDLTVTIHLVHATKTVAPGDEGVTHDSSAYGDLFKTVTQTTKQTKANKQLPQTGNDANAAGVAGLGLASLTAMLGLGMKKRRD